MSKSVKACDFVIFCCLRSRFVQEKDVDLSGGGAQVLCSWVGRMVMSMLDVFRAEARRKAELRELSFNKSVVWRSRFFLRVANFLLEDAFLYFLSPPSRWWGGGGGRERFFLGPLLYRYLARC